MYDISGMIEQPALVEELAGSLESLHSRLLTSVKIKLTSKCNLRCQMCKYWKTRTETALSTEQWLSVIEQLAEMGCRKIHFSGGEVFLRNDFLDMVERGSELGLKINMTTNGTLLNRDRARRLIRARPNSISLSLDGPSAGVHDKIRGLPGSFRRTCRTIRKLGDYGQRYGRTPKIRINFVVMRANYRRTAEMVELAHALGAIELHPMPVDEKGEPVNRLSRHQMERYNAEVAPEVLEARRRCGFSTDPGLVYPFGRSRSELKQAREGHYSLGFYQKKPCLSPWMHLFFAWDGETYLCCMTNGRMESLGNVGTTPVADIFNGPAMQQVRRDFLALQHPKACATCDMVLTENHRLHAALERQFTSR
ncbi:MAG: radical SAM protein [Vulcanimicrobiota bacterium]